MSKRAISLSTTTQKVFEQLLDSFGPQHWWPGNSPLEVMVGAVLVQNTNWKNVERALENLRASDALDASRILALDEQQLQQLLRPAGYYRLKARRLRSLMQFFVERYDGSIEQMGRVRQQELRKQLLAVHGIGPETADAILLYALDKPAMVVDTYTHRVFARHGWVAFEADYHQLQAHLMSELPEDVSTYNELHALLVQVGKSYCGKVPRCEECPLVDMLPKGGVCIG